MSIAKPSSPSISIVIPTYNRAAWIGECLEGALRQTVNPAEVIVIDDGSEDETESAVAGYLNSGVRYIRKTHTGASDTRNQAIAECRGEYVLTIGSDDVIFENAIELLLETYLRYPGRLFYYGNIVATDANLNPQFEVVYPNWKDDEERLRSALVFTNQIGDGFGMIRREALDRLGGYSVEFPRCQDWEFWARARSELSVAHCGETIGYWRWHGENLSGNRTQHSQVDVDRKIRERLRMAKSGDQHLRDLGWGVGVAVDAGRPVWIWGAGESGLAMRSMLERMELLVEAFVDSDLSKEGSLFGGLLVKSPAELGNLNARPYILVASVYEHEIAASLESLGFREFEDYDRVHGVEYHRLT